MYTNIVTSLFHMPSIKPNTHNYGFHKLWANLLEPYEGDCEVGNRHSSMKKHSKIYLTHGCVAEFTNYNVNTISGFGAGDCSKTNNARKILEAYERGAQIFFIDKKYGDTRKPRLLANRVSSGKPIYNGLSSTMLQGLLEMSATSTVITMADLPQTSAIIGDSHCMAFAGKGQAFYKVDGKTLHSVLYKDTLVNFVENNIEPRVLAKLQNLTICLGSIDIQFHLAYYESPTVPDLINKYVDEIRLLKLAYPHLAISITAPVPTVSEDLVLCKSACYKGESYRGARDMRDSMTHDFIDCIRRTKPLVKNIVVPPSDWYVGDFYQHNIKEQGRAVHIAPTHYLSAY